MVLINHFIGAIVTPLNLGLAILAVGLIWRRMRIVTFWGGAAWIWLWSTPLMFGLLGQGLENRYPPKNVKDVGCADAIVVLGGGMGANTNLWPYVECWMSADRAVHGARLWKAGKAPRLIATGDMAEVTTVPFLEELGVPREVITCLDAKNTEEEGRAVACEAKRVILVTSAWHMRRAELMFNKAGLEVEPVGCDYEVLIRKERRFTFGWGDLWPSSEMLFYNTYLFKEHYAYWGYKWLRGF